MVEKKMGGFTWGENVFYITIAGKPTQLVFHNTL
jgi:hypothetical protein